MDENNLKDFKEYMMGLKSNKGNKLIQQRNIDTIVGLFKDEQYEILGSILKKLPIDKSDIFSVLCQMVTTCRNDAILFKFCEMLKWLADDIISLKHYLIVNDMPEEIAKIACDWKAYSNDVLYYFAQTLEYLYAKGYDSLGATIYGLYRHIRQDSLYNITALTISKELSVVYMIDDDNKYKIAKKCKKIHKSINKLNRHDLESLCLYYMGLVDKFDFALFHNKELCEEFWMYLTSGYMELSCQRGFKLAKIYCKHHS